MDNAHFSSLLASPAGFAMQVDDQFVMPKHLQLLNQHLVDLATGRLRRLIVQMPPRHGKSELCSKFFPAWFLGLWPNKRIILASYEAHFAASWGAKARDLIEEYGSFFDVRLDPGNRATSHWGIDGCKGSMMTAGVGGPMTGKGADVLIIDDPVKNESEAMSETMRQKAWDWFRSVARTRLEPGASIMVIMTRWHHDDLAGRLIQSSKDVDAFEREEYKVLSLPALAIHNDPIGRKPGEALWPQRFNEAALAVTRKTLGGYWFSSLYQQTPTPEEGGLIKREWFRHYNRVGSQLHHVCPPGRDPQTLPEPAAVGDLLRFITVDLAVTLKQTSDFTVAQVWGEANNGNVYLLDQERIRLEGPDIVPMLKRLAAKWNVAIVWIERTGFQLAVVQQARREGLPVRELEADREKVQRALAATPHLEAGFVWFPAQAVWLEDLQRELLEFPFGQHDDQVDALAYSLAYCIRQRGLLLTPPTIKPKQFTFPRHIFPNEPSRY